MSEMGFWVGNPGGRTVLGYDIRTSSSLQHYESSIYGTWIHGAPRGCSLRSGNDASDYFSIRHARLSELCDPATQIRFKLTTSAGGSTGRLYFSIRRNGTSEYIVAGRTVAIRHECDSSDRLWIEYVGVMGMHEGRGRCTPQRGNRSGRQRAVRPQIRRWNEYGRAPTPGLRPSAR